MLSAMLMKESDSGAFSDRYLLEDQPLKVIFGMVICGYVIGSNEGVLYIRENILNLLKQ